MSAGDKMKKELVSIIGEKLSLPPESIGEIPLMEIRGNCSIIIENHRGILEYDDEAVKISVKHGAVQIHGNELRVFRMSEKIVEIRGRIRSVEMEQPWE